MNLNDLRLPPPDNSGTDFAFLIVFAGVVFLAACFVAWIFEVRGRREIRAWLAQPPELFDQEVHAKQSPRWH